MKKNYIVPISLTNRKTLHETFLVTMSKSHGSSGDKAETKREEEELEEEEEFINYIISQENQSKNSLW